MHRQPTDGGERLEKHSSSFHKAEAYGGLSQGTTRETRVGVGGGLAVAAEWGRPTLSLNESLDLAGDSA